MNESQLDWAPIDAETLIHLLVGSDRLWTDVQVSESTGSTNADAAAAARAGAPEGTIIATEQQVAGRGRLDRTWETVPGAAIAVSVVLRPAVLPVAWVWLPILAGIAVDAMARELGVPSALKWPNDVQVDGRKLAGILLERVETSDGPAAIVGIGLNVTLRDDELPVPTATSLLLEGASLTDRTGVLEVLLRHLEDVYTAWIAVDGDPGAGLRATYLERCDTVGRTVRVELPDGSDLVGDAETVDQHGRLVVAGQAVSAGDVTHVRAIT